MNNKKLTIYTPVYNRAYIINQVFQSLVRQTSYNFIWMIIDDGSTDNLKQLVNKWSEQSLFEIQYFYQENQGKQEAVNFAHKNIHTELNVCVDSDDFLLDNAVEIIISEWDKVKADDKLAGIVGLDIDKSGNVIGTKFPGNLSKEKFSHFRKRKIKGDKKFVYRTVVIREFVYPRINNEKFPAPGYIYRLIDQNYFLALINKPLCVVEYLPDGLSRNKFSQFKKSNLSFIFYRLERMRLAISYSDKFKNAIHYVSLCLIGKRNIFNSNPYKITTFFAFPLGLSLFIYLSKTNKKGVI